MKPDSQDSPAGTQAGEGENAQRHGQGFCGRTKVPRATCQPEPDADPEDTEGQVRDEMRNSAQVGEAEAEDAPGPAGGPE